MKKLISVLVLMCASISFAQSSPPVFERQKASYVVFKNIVELKNDRYEFRREKVCTGSFNFDAYDLRNYNDGFGVPQRDICETTYDGKKVIFNISSFSGVFFDEAFGNVESKLYNLGLWLRNSDGSQITTPEVPSGQAGTLDIHNKQMILHVSAPQFVTCTSGEFKISKFTPSADGPQPPPGSHCEVMNPVTFSASVLFESL